MVSVYDAALRLLWVRARSRAELDQRLRAKGFDPSDVDEVMARLEGQGLIDDAAFADEWVRSRHVNHAKGRTALRHELVAKGVADSIIVEALAQIDDDDEREQARVMAAKKLSRVDPDDLATPQGRAKYTRRLSGTLGRRGYAPPIVVAVVREAIDEHRLGAS